MAARFPGLLDARAHRARAHACASSTTSSPRRCTASPAPTTTGRARASKPWLAQHRRADAGAQRAATIRSCPAASLPHARRSVSAAVTLEYPRARRPRRLRRPARSPARIDWLPQRLLHSSRRCDAAASACGIPASVAQRMLHALAPEIFKAYDIRGIVGKTLTPTIVRADRPRARHARARARRDTHRDRPRRPPVRARARRGARRRPPRRRRRRDRHRHGRRRR